MRLSLLEHEAQQRREAEERARNSAEDSSNTRPRAESRDSPPSPPNAEVGSDTANPTVLSTPTTFDISPASSSSTPNLTTVSLPAPQQVRESPPNGPSSSHNSMQGASSSYAVHSPLSRMDSLASSIATHETSAGLDGYRFLPSESEESIISREPLLHVEETDA